MRYQSNYVAEAVSRASRLTHSLLDVARIEVAKAKLHRLVFKRREAVVCGEKHPVATSIKSRSRAKCHAHQIAGGVPAKGKRDPDVGILHPLHEDAESNKGGISTRQRQSIEFTSVKSPDGFDKKVLGDGQILIPDCEIHALTCRNNAHPVRRRLQGVLVLNCISQ